MAKFQVVLQPEAERNVLAIFAWISARSPQGAVAWYQALENAIERVRQSADRFPIAPESGPTE